ncbi:MAG: hypothetical protein GWP14_07770 [Actinobacteria bacterium]|nr:hypothetical protein [Actinomycetota bacterium]
MMAEDKKKSCYCGGVLAIVIAVLTLLAMHGIIAGLWVSIVVLVLAILIAIGSLANCCCCAKFCKPKEGE